MSSVATRKAGSASASDDATPSSHASGERPASALATPIGIPRANAKASAYRQLERDGASVAMISSTVRLR